MSSLTRLQRRISRKLNKTVMCSVENGAVKLEGEAASWEEVVLAGKLAAKLNYRGVINRLTVKGLTIPTFSRPSFTDKAVEGMSPDVLIIGGGVIGASIARELSKWDIKLMLVDKENDVAIHQSSRNDGMVHPGIVHPGSLKARYNIRGNELFEAIARELDVPYKTIGTYILFDSRLVSLLGGIFIKWIAKKNGAKGVRRVSARAIRARIPGVAKGVVGGIVTPTAGACPSYEMTTALMESAVINGLKLSLETAVTDMFRTDNRITEVITNRGRIYPKVIINAAGLWADEVAAMAGDQFFTIHPRKGEIALLDKSKSGLLDTVISIVSPKLLFGNTKGGGLVRTVEGNILVGPNAFEQPYKEDYSTDGESMTKLLDQKLPLLKGLSRQDVITYFAGNRAATYKEDFIIEKSRSIDNLIYAAGIQSPGYASFPAIAEEIEKLTVETLRESMEVTRKQEFIKGRKGKHHIKDLPKEERAELIKKCSDYGEIICRCEEISKGEIIDAIHSPVPALTVDAIKRRTRAGMGRCQGGFCTPLIARILAEETGKSMIEVMKKGRGSNLVAGETKAYKKPDSLAR